jgi:GNAT superfamily N-acetyltransferase
VNIIPLADMPAAIQTLARWFHGEWHSFDGRCIETIQAQLSDTLNREYVPITFVACEGTDVLGAASLDRSDLPGFDHLSPWLSSLYVEPGARSRGIGSALVRHVQRFACSHAFNEIYLWSPGVIRLYERCGWIAIDTTLYSAQRITIMRFRCETTNAYQDHRSECGRATSVAQFRP